MSGIYIPGMKMPKSCLFCPFLDDEFCEDYFGLFCSLTKERLYDNERLNRCPLIALSPHGRLIDADAFITKIENAPDRNNEDTVYPLTFRDWFDAIIHDLRSEKSTPTIVPADGGESE